MTELVYFAAFYIFCALLLLFRLWKGPSAVDRTLTCDCIDVLTDVALVLYAMYSGRGIFLDVALVTAVLGFVGTTLISKYLEGTL